MPKKEQEDSIISETGNWNVADSYSKSKIMRPLIQCDYYEDIAIFGYDSIADELINFEAPPNDIIRFRALRRLIKELLRLVDNTKFALKKPKTKEEILGYRSNLVSLEQCLPKLIKINFNQITNKKTMSISNESLFGSILDKVSQIKSKINEPLNKNHLIFTDREEFDPKSFKAKLKDRMVNKG